MTFIPMSADELRMIADTVEKWNELYADSKYDDAFTNVHSLEITVSAVNYGLPLGRLELYDDYIGFVPLPRDP